MKIEELDDIDMSMFEDSYMKVIIQNKSNPYLFDLFIDRLTKTGVHDLQIIEDLFSLDMDNESDIIDEAKSTMEILESYVEQIESNVSKKKLKGLFHGLYNEAMALE